MTVKIWKSVIDNIKKRLAIWKGKSMYVDRRVVMINSVMNAMPIYTLSFYKAPLIVIREIVVKIQNNFMWMEVILKVHSWGKLEVCFFAKREGWLRHQGYQDFQ